MNSIADLLDLEDPNISISDVQIEGQTKTLTVETRPSCTFCPECGYRMHSRGVKVRSISHPIFQDGYALKIKLKQRRWKCTNPDCKYDIQETFKFVDKNRRRTNASDLLIIEAFRDLNQTSVDIAKRFHTTDTYVNEVFDRYIKLDRLPLTDIISVDEVHTEILDSSNYSLIIQDFYTGNPIDVLMSRKQKDTEPYFAAIPIEERRKVRYLISDMYNPYIQYVDKYFPNATPVVDSFHVVQWIIHLIDQFIRKQIKQFKERDKNEFLRKHPEINYTLDRPRIPLSDEVYILQKYRWLILSNQNNITYHVDLRRDTHFGRMMNTYSYEDCLFRYVPRLRTLRDLKEMYISFNTRNAGDPINAAKELDELILHYRNCNDSIFKDFAGTLYRYRNPIITSFVMVEKCGPGGIYDARLSNGPIESLNRKVKDLKRSGRGYRNFEHFRNRFLFSTRNRPVLNGISDSRQIQYFDEEDFD